MQLYFIASLAALLCLGQAEIRIGFTSQYYNHGAVGLAIDRAQSEGLLQGQTISYYARSTGCNSLSIPGPVLDMMVQDNIDVLIGPVCSISCVAAGQVATYFNTPMFPSYCEDPKVDNKTIFPTVIRLMGDFELYGQGLLRYLQYYNWDRVLFLYQGGNEWCEFGQSVVGQYITSYVTVVERVAMAPAPTDSDLVSYLRTVQKRARIVILCHSSTAVMARVLFKAQDLGMSRGDYAFIKHNVNYDENNNFLAQLPASGSERTRRMRAYYMFKQIGASKEMTDADLNTLVAQVAQRNQLAPWNSMVPAGATPNSYARVVYDNTYLWATLASQMIDAGLDYTDGNAMLNFAKGKAFSGILGSVTLNQNADTKRPLSVFSFGPGSTEFTPYMSIDLIQNTIQILNSNVVWGEPNNKVPPVDTPLWGYYC